MNLRAFCGTRIARERRSQQSLASRDRAGTWATPSSFTIRPAWTCRILCGSDSKVGSVYALIHCNLDPLSDSTPRQASVDTLSGMQILPDEVLSALDRICRSPSFQHAAR